MHDTSMLDDASREASPATSPRGVKEKSWRGGDFDHRRIDFSSGAWFRTLRDPPFDGCAPTTKHRRSMLIAVGSSLQWGRSEWIGGSI
jgi:hypothetical protein